MSREYSADFETTTNPDDCRVWAWAIENIHDLDDIYYGNDIASFVDKMLSLSYCTIYFHNLRFDSQFIIWYLLESGWQCVSDSKCMKEMTFSVCINGDNQIYAMDICYKKSWRGHRAFYKKIKIYDSLKKLPFPVKKIAKDFQLPIQKLTLDYIAEREKGHQFTPEEKQYLRNDVEIVARALDIQFQQGLTRMTIGSDALGSYKELIGGKKKFEAYFPKLDIQTDKELRKAYHGGWTYVSPLYQDMDVEDGKVYDVNSLYPWAMRYNIYPIGKPFYYEGQYRHDPFRPLYIQRFACEFKLKKDHLPCVQVKNSYLYSDKEYLVQSEELTTLTMSNVDLDLFFEQYEVWNITYICCWAFEAKDGLFNAYIDHWGHVKETSKGAIRQIAKLMLNNLYGKFATSPNIIEKMPVMEDGAVKYVVSNTYVKDAIYIPVGIFCTSYARAKTIRTAQKVYGRFAYADTDSLHLVGTEVPPELDGEIDDNILGKWKNESNFVRARFVKAKTYIEEEEITKDKFESSESKLDYERDGNYYHLNVKCAGMPDSAKELVTFDNFHVGFTAGGKLIPKNVRGGVVLQNTEFTIKDFKKNKTVL